MPANFPELWLGRVRNKFEDVTVAPWLEGVDEIQANVHVIGEGESEKNKIYIPKSEFKVDVLINNTTYPLDVQDYDDDTIEITLDKYQTKPAGITEDQAIGASYDKIDNATKAAQNAIPESKYEKAIHSICPQANTVSTPILETTGEDDGTGRNRMTYADLVNLSKKCKNKNKVCHLVLNEDHWHDLLLDRKNFGDQLVNYKKGEPAPEIAGLKLFRNTTDMPLIASDLTKKPFGSIKEVGDREASVLFNVKKVAKKNGFTRQYYDKPTTTMQKHLVAYRHYFVAVPYENEGIGAIV